jgi:hypothetical protein
MGGELSVVESFRMKEDVCNMGLRQISLRDDFSNIQPVESFIPEELAWSGASSPFGRAAIVFASPESTCGQTRSEFFELPNRFR